MKKQPGLSVIAMSFVLILSSGCKKENPAFLPVLTTFEVSSISNTSARSGGRITSDGGSTIIARGVCWSSSATPTIAENKTSDGRGIGSFTSSITGLSPETTYFVRAYATNSEGTAYGSAYQFTTSKAPAEIITALIPAGTFTMGSPASEVGRRSDETQHQVTLSAFKMSKYEVTFEQYDLFCDATGRSKPNDEGWGRGNRPVINVSWHDATAFAEWMGCRLPTEAEWEYACRAGTTTPFSTGNNLTTSQANYDGNYPYNNNAKGEYRKKTLQVGSFAANAYGLFDMHGNVWEWCSDWYGDYSTSAQTNPKGASSGSHRVIRGGSWIINAPSCRAADRYDITPVYRNSTIGFRPQ